MECEEAKYPHLTDLNPLFVISIFWIGFHENTDGNASVEDLHSMSSDPLKLRIWSLRGIIATEQIRAEQYISLIPL